MRGCSLIITGIAFFYLSDWTWSREITIGPCILVLEGEGDCPDTNYIKTYLFTRKNEEEGQYVEFTKTWDNMTSSHFNFRHPNKLIIHGYNSDMNMYALLDIKEEYLRQEEANVWMVDYPRLAEGSTICYPFAVHNIRHVGHCLAQLITTLHRHNSIDIHVVGFSLGAHVANYMANKLAPLKLPRITGLDPAGPLFMSRNERHRLDPSDADFVDVVHTNGLIQGNIERSGHIDFYMNGGVSQPGCLNESNPFACDHHRAAEYFVESISSKIGFLGWQCEGYVEYLAGECKPNMQLAPMGEKCSSGNKGFYVAYTAAEKPFALGNWTSGKFWERAPKTSFTKMPRNLTNEIGTNKNSELLKRIPPTSN